MEAYIRKKRLYTIYALKNPRFEYHRATKKISLPNFDFFRKLGHGVFRQKKWFDYKPNNHSVFYMNAMDWNYFRIA